ncbi:protein ALP1-like [Citrus clementina]|uniref:protein ALP1-like n=1 Tax=Citrus clementina TaxID=85681 RepID=UPI000CED22D1|nr:protein ALP1-like [Citrus x clementina]
MDRQTFTKLCNMLQEEGGLVGSTNVSLEEMLAMFLYILAPHMKNWNCLGALDGTYIKVHVPEVDKPKYRTRKNEIATNVLGVCSQDMQFIYVLPRWEGSTHDMCVLRDALTRRNGLKVPHGHYYLVDTGYTNGNGFLAPFRGERYHLSDYRDGHQPTTPAEFFNMRHSSARNVIARCFGLPKKRWVVLRSPSFYDIKIQRRIIYVCCMLHNFIRREMPYDDMQMNFDDEQPDES